MRSNIRFSGSFLRVAAFLTLAMPGLSACRSPQDPSGIDSPLGRDGGTAPANPEIQPNTDKPIGPIATGTSQGGAPTTPEQHRSGGAGGLAGGGSGGFAGSTRVASVR